MKVLRKEPKGWFIEWKVRIPEIFFRRAKPPKEDKCFHCTRETDTEIGCGLVVVTCCSRARCKAKMAKFVRGLWALEEVRSGYANLKFDLKDQLRKEVDPE